MGEVYRARDTRLGREVALKIMRPELADDPTRRQRFEREARSASRLNHPNIVAIFDIGDEAGHMFIVSELVSGEPLKALIQRGSVPSPQLLSIAAQIAEGLAAAHAADLVHRDLKPDNVILTKTGIAKILDFGLAKETRGFPEGGDQQTLTLTVAPTESGLIVGTVGYMSPEQAGGSKVDFRSDQFSLGMILYEMASGRQPFPRGTAVQVLSAIIAEEPPPLPASTPAPLRWIVERCLAKDPARRYHATADLAEDLRRAGAQSGELTTPGAPPSKRTRWVLPVAAAVALAAGFAISTTVRPESAGFAELRYTPIATDAAVEASPAFSPDGRSVAYLVYLDVPQLFTRNLDSPTPVQVTRDSHASFFPFWSPDGSRIYYTSSVTSSRDLMVVGSGGGTPEVVLPNLGGHFFSDGAAISRDGKTLAVFRLDPATGVYSIWTSSPPGAAPHKFQPSPFEQRVLGAPAKLRFSPDGKKLLFAFGDALHNRPEFWVIPWPEGSGAPRKILGSIFESTPFVGGEWMPDSRHVVLSLEPKLKTGSHVWIADTDTGELRALTGGQGIEVDPTVSPDGRRVAFSTFSDNFDLVEIPVDGQPEHSVAWSPVREQYAYITNRNGTSEIWVHSVGERWDHPLVTQKDFPEETVEAFVAPQFSPDGERIAYGMFGSRGSGIWISSVAGSSPTRLLPDGMSGVLPIPTWSPDGNWIAFRSDRPDGAALEKIRVGSTQSVVVKKTATPFGPQWSPDGKWIMLQLPEGFGVVSPDGSQLRVLNQHTDPGAGVAHGWSRDGKSIYSVYPGPSGSSLSRVDVDTGVEHVLADLGPGLRLEAGYLWGARLSMSPDGKRLATSVSRRSGDLWMVAGFETPRAWYRRLWPFP
jgi:serine/threonine protein kinase